MNLPGYPNILQQTVAIPYQKTPYHSALESVRGHWPAMIRETKYQDDIHSLDLLNLE
jgi:hypothetical protein